MGKTGYLGIDVSKGYADFLLLDADCNEMEAGFQLHDNKEGRQELKKLITEWQKQGLEELYCGVESTGGYESNWYACLKSLKKEGNIWVCRLNPHPVKAVSDANLKRTITDRVSAENIAAYLVKFASKVDYGDRITESSDACKEGRQHSTYIKMLLKQKVQLNNQFEKLVYQHFSEVLVYCRHGMPTWLLLMLAKYPSAPKALKAGAEKLCVIKGISKDRAKAIIDKVKGSEQSASSHVEHLIKVTASEILHKEKLVKEEKQYLADLYKDTEAVQLITSIPGVGVDSAVAIALEIEDISRFDTSKKLCAYFGVHPTFRQSGDGQWDNHMSKKGRAAIRGILYMTTLAAIRHNPLLKQLYARFRGKGKCHYDAAGVVMHKMLRIIFGLLKNKTTFCAATDEQNQQRSAIKQKEQEERANEMQTIKQEKKYRFQQPTKQAPISRRAEQKLKKQTASQTS